MKRYQFRKLRRAHFIADVSSILPMQNNHARHAKLGWTWGERVCKFQGLYVWYLSSWIYLKQRCKFRCPQRISLYLLFLAGLNPMETTEPLEQLHETSYLDLTS
jgi:hypothetical protein